VTQRAEEKEHVTTEEILGKKQRR